MTVALLGISVAFAGIDVTERRADVSAWDLTQDSAGHRSITFDFPVDATDVRLSRLTGDSSANCVLKPAGSNGNRDAYRLCDDAPVAGACREVFALKAHTQPSEQTVRYQATYTLATESGMTKKVGEVSVALTNPSLVSTRDVPYCSKATLAGPNAPASCTDRLPTHPEDGYVALTYMSDGEPLRLAPSDFTGDFALYSDLEERWFGVTGVASPDLVDIGGNKVLLRVTSEFLRLRDPAAARMRARLHSGGEMDVIVVDGDPSTHWCQREFGNRVFGRAKEVDFLLCLDLMKGTPGGVALFAGDGLPRDLDASSGLFIEAGRDLFLLTRSETTPKLEVKDADSAIGLPQAELDVAATVELLARDPSKARVEPPDEDSRTVHTLFYLPPRVKGNPFELKLTESPKPGSGDNSGDQGSADREVNLSIVTLKRYHGGFRTSVILPVELGPQITTRTGAGGIDVLDTTGNATTSGPALMFGYAWYGRNGRVIEPRKPFRRRFNGLVGISSGIIRFEGEPDGPTRLELGPALSGVYLGGELQLGRFTSVGAVAGARTGGRWYRRGFGEGVRLPEGGLDDATRLLVHPTVSVVISVHPDFFAVATRGGGS